MPEPSVLIAVTDDAVRTFLTDNLKADGFVVDDASDSSTARIRLKHGRAAVLLGELEQPRAAVKLLHDLRAERLAPADPDGFVIVLSANRDELGCLRAFDAGADDVIASPFSYPELRARLRAVLRRRRPHWSRRLVVGDLDLDLGARSVTLAGRPITLTGKEYDLLCVLAAEPTRVFTRRELLSEVWGPNGSRESRTVDTHACRLRRKLSATDRTYVTNIWGVGYRLVDRVAAAEPGDFAP